MLSHSDVLKAVAFASLAHGEQVRKYTGERYLYHLLAVAADVALHTNDPDVIIAAVLHDTLEDTATSYHDLVGRFGHRVAWIVNELTDVYTSAAFPDLNRKARKMREAERLGSVSKEAQLVKVFDLIDNTRTIVEHDPKFAEVYLAEKRAVLQVLTKVNPAIVKQARDILGDTA